MTKPAPLAKTIRGSGQAHLSRGLSQSGDASLIAPPHRWTTVVTAALQFVRSIRPWFKAADDGLRNSLDPGHLQNSSHS
jgi:hypothetical protein